MMVYESAVGSSTLGTGATFMFLPSGCEFEFNALLTLEESIRLSEVERNSVPV